MSKGFGLRMSLDTFSCRSMTKGYGLKSTRQPLSMDGHRWRSSSWVSRSLDSPMTGRERRRLQSGLTSIRIMRRPPGGTGWLMDPTCGHRVQWFSFLRRLPNHRRRRRPLSHPDFYGPCFVSGGECYGGDQGSQERLIRDQAFPRLVETVTMLTLFWEDSS
jgi:hypothetical protein